MTDITAQRSPDTGGVPSAGTNRADLDFHAFILFCLGYFASSGKVNQSLNYSSGSGLSAKGSCCLWLKGHRSAIIVFVRHARILTAALKITQRP